MTFTLVEVIVFELIAMFVGWALGFIEGTKAGIQSKDKDNDT